MERDQASPATSAGPVTVSFGGATPAESVTAAYEAYAAPIFSFLLRATRERETAADLLQETFLRLMRESRAGRQPEDVRAWLYRVAANLVASRGRRLSVMQRWLHRMVLGGEASSPEAEYLLGEQQHELAARLQTLPRDARLGLLLAAHGFSGQEIAAALGKSELATRSLMCRARRRLREEMAGTELAR